MAPITSSGVAVPVTTITGVAGPYAAHAGERRQGTGENQVVRRRGNPSGLRRGMVELPAGLVQRVAQRLTQLRIAVEKFRIRFGESMPECPFKLLLKSLSAPPRSPSPGSRLP